MQNTVQVNNRPTPWIMCIGIIILFLIPYGIVNHLPLDRYTIPFLFGEEHIPFLPWTFSIYISAFLQAVLVIRFIPRKLLLRALPLAFGMICIGLIAFLIMPIEYPRNLCPSTNSAIILFRATDTTGNCFPSLHVAMTLFLTACYYLIEKSLKKKLLMWTWTIAIIISVLTTKQHYVIDIAGGVVLAIPFMLLLKKKLKTLSLDLK